MNAKKLNERADLDMLLKLLLELDGFSPDSIVHADKPDFRISMQDWIIGLETTRSDPEEYFRALSIQASKYPHLCINTTHFKNRPSRRTNKALEKSMGYNALLQPWRPVEAGMLEWTQKIDTALNSKRHKFNRLGYQMFDENWLLIHDHSPLPNDEFTQKRAGQHLTRLFRAAPDVARDFDTVFVHSGDYLFRWRKGELELAS